MLVLFAACGWLGQRLLVRHWAVWVLGAGASCALLLAIALVAGLSPAYRRTVVARVNDAVRGLRKLRR
jgi:hypothetical protein